MPMQTDVKASKTLTASGAFQDQGNKNIGRTRIRGIYAINVAAAGNVLITDGVSGTTLLSLDTPAVANMGYTAFSIPGEGILSENGPAATLTGITSVVIFYG
jgi:hypothetical protein